MTRRPRILTPWHGRLADDSGVSLIFAMIFITVIALITGVVLTLIDTNLRTTIVMRDQATEAAEADGAAQIAINQLRTGDFDGAGNCFSGGPNLPLYPGFYSGAAGSADSARVECVLDTLHSDPLNSANSPADAIVTTGTATPSLFVDMVGSSPPLKVGGNVKSLNRIRVEAGDFVATGINASDCSGTVTAPDTMTPACQPLVGYTVPSYSVPTSAPAPSDAFSPTPSSCNRSLHQLITFHPGRYRNVAVLNQLTNTSMVGVPASKRCNDAVFYFEPGFYYFDFGAADWTITSGSLVAGTPHGWTPGVNQPAIPGACDAPVTTAEFGPWNPGPGVEFIFAGSSRMLAIKDNPNPPPLIEICGTYDRNRPPIALHGLASSFGSLPLATSCGSTTCAMITVQKNSDAELYVQGMTYAPRSTLNLDLKKDTSQLFSHGVIAGLLDISGTGNADPNNPAFTVQRTINGSSTVVLLTVRVCPDSGACGPSGAVRLKAKVRISDPSGVPVPGQRQITVLSWSLKR